MQTKSEQLLFTTTIIEINDKQGTAFFYKTKTDKIILITNKHVIVEEANQDSAIRTANPEKQLTLLHLSNGQNKLVSFSKCQWIIHPSSDLAACAFEDILKLQDSSEQTKFIYNCLKFSDIPKQQDLENLSALETIVTAGYPQGLYDNVNNLPLLRTGFTSSHPAIDYNGEKEGVLDLNNFPGQSGSPVCILNEGYYHTKDGSLVLGDQFFLIGIIKSMTVRINNVIRKSDKKEIEYNDLYIKENTGLCYYVKSSEIEYFEKIFI